MADGVTTKCIESDFDSVLHRIQELLSERGVKLFCVIDHSGEAAAVGLQMPRTKLLIFGNAKAGTPIMLATPTAALDLPLKLLVAETPQGTVELSWNDSAWLRRRHGFDETLKSNIGAVDAIAHSLSQEPRRIS